MNSAAQLSRAVYGSGARLTEEELAAGIVYKKAGFYSCLISAVASGAAGSGTTQIQQDSSFRIEALMHQTVVNNAFVEFPYTTVQITDGGSDQNLFDRPLMLGAVFGTGQLPLVLPTPYTCKPNSVLTFALTNVNSAAAATYYMVLLGTRLYRKG